MTAPLPPQKAHESVPRQRVKPLPINAGQSRLAEVVRTATARMTSGQNEINQWQTRQGGAGPDPADAGQACRR